MVPLILLDGITDLCSRAAEIAGSSAVGSKLSAAALGGFAQFASPSFQASQSYVASTAPRSGLPGRSGSPSSGSSSPGAFDSDLSNVQVITNGELAMILKRLMTKRDTTTKLRALEDLETWIKGQPEDADSNTSMTPTQEAIGPWVKLYIKLTTDVDRRVRFLTNNVHALVVKRAKKKLAPFLKEVVGAWIGTFFDPSRDVARVAMESFKSAFPDNKREQVLVFCLKDLIAHISENLLNKTPETLSDPRFTTPEEMETRFARVVASALYTLGYLFENVSEEGLKQGAAEINTLLDEQKLWKYFGFSNAMVRRATYSFLRSIINKAPKLVPERLQLISKEFFPAALNDTDMAAHGDMWDALLVLTKGFPEAWQTPMDNKKPVTSLFANFLKAAGHGSTTATYRSLLPLVSNWNDATIVGKNGTGMPFIKLFFEDIWKGLDAPLLERGKDSAGLLLEAYAECLVYFIVRFGKSEATEPGQLGTMEIMTTLVKQFLQGFTSSKAAVKLDDEQNVAKRISTHLAVLLGVPSIQNKVVEGVWNPIVNVMQELVAKGNDSEYIKRGKRIVLLLSELSHIATEKNDEALSEKIDKAVDGLVQIVAKQCASDSQQAIPAFFDSQFVDILLTSEDTNAATSDEQSIKGSGSASLNESLSHLLDLFAGYLGNSKEPETAAKVWKDVIHSILRSNASAGEDRRMTVLQGILERMRGSSATFTMGLEELDQFVLTKTTRADYASSIALQQLLCSSLHVDSIIAPSVQAQIVEHLITDFEKHVRDLETVDSSGILEDGEKGSMVSLHILSESCANIVPLLAADDKHIDLLKRLIVSMFDLILHREEDAQKCLQQIHILSEGQSDLRYLLEDALTDHIKNSLKDMTRTASPEDFVNQVRQLATLLDLHDSEDKYSLYKSFFFDREHWAELRQHVSSKPDMALAVLDPIIAALHCTSKGDGVARVQERPVTDAFGLTAYGRLAVFTFELLKKEDWTVLVLQHPEEMTWILGELLTVRQHFLDTLDMPSLKTCALYSADHDEESSQHTEANAIVFRAMAREIGALVMKWLTVATQEEEWEANLIQSLQAHIQHQPAHLDDDDDRDMIERGLLNYFADLAFTQVDGYSERIFAKLLQAAFSITNSEVSPSDAKAWCQVLKNDKVSLSLSTALVVTLTNRLRETNEFNNLLNYWASELGAVRPHEATTTNAILIRRLVLLSSAFTTPTPTPLSLPQHRAINLLQSIRRWEESESVLLTPPEEEQSQLVFARLLALLGALADQVQELPGAHWDLMVELIDSTFETLATEAAPDFTSPQTHSSGALVVLEQASRLAVKLIELSDSEEDIQRTWEEHSESILVHALQAMGAEAAGKIHHGNDFLVAQMDRPRRKYQEALAQLCEYADRSVVLSHGSTTDYCGLLMLPSMPLQRLAYIQLQTLLADQVEALAIQLEVEGPRSPAIEEESPEAAEGDTQEEQGADSDKMDKPKFPASLWAIISQPPSGYPAMDVNVDANDDDEEREQEFSFLAAPDLTLGDSDDEDAQDAEKGSATRHESEHEDEDQTVGGVAAKQETFMSHAVLGYLLAWKLAFGLFENTTYKVKSGLAGQLRQAATMEGFLPYLFHLLGIRQGGAGVTSSDDSETKKKKAHEPFDLSRWNIVEYHVEGFDFGSPEVGFPLLAGHLYFVCLANVPSLARIWWTECKSRQLSIAVEQLTEKAFSSLLVARELDSLQKAQSSAVVAEELKELQIKVSKNTSEVTASFQIDEATMEIVIRLPTNFPLRQIEVEGTQRVGVKESRWRAWMLAVAGVVAAQNGSLIDALTMFRRNVGLHFDGVEDCTICYSIVSLQDRSLPTKTCKTCKNKFHASCLYKWFHSSANSASCPLCRTLW
ncbi:hypothetical protein BGW42_008079 [Actinomortierella wolfii]|nr:hypothetical protein BGW42_008079 [Actinomortierella wolfii]